MLTEQRYEKILKLLEFKKSVTVTELKTFLDTSESTIRRDLNSLDRAGKLVKVFGGAVSADTDFVSGEPSVAQKAELCHEEKLAIGRYAASLITPGDFIYLDAGTTTGAMLDFLEEKSVTFVTNAVDHAKRLAVRGFKVILTGGELKGKTEAVIGSQAIMEIQKYHFTKGFFGVNGISREAGYTTPDAGEALVKENAFLRCRAKYVLGDHTKFGHISPVTFGALEQAVIVTDGQAEDKPYGNTEIIKVHIEDNGTRL